MMDIVTNAIGIMMSGGGGKTGNNMIKIIGANCTPVKVVPIIGPYTIKYYNYPNIPELCLGANSCRIHYLTDDKGVITEILDTPNSISTSTIIQPAFCKDDKILWFFSSRFATYADYKQYKTDGTLAAYQHDNVFDFDNATYNVKINTTNSPICDVVLSGSYKYIYETWGFDEHYSEEKTGTYTVYASINQSLNTDMSGIWSELSAEDALSELQDFWTYIINNK